MQKKKTYPALDGHVVLAPKRTHRKHRQDNDQDAERPCPGQDDPIAAIQTAGGQELGEEVHEAQC